MKSSLAGQDATASAEAFVRNFEHRFLRHSHHLYLGSDPIGRCCSELFIYGRNPTLSPLRASLSRTHAHRTRTRLTRARARRLYQILHNLRSSYQLMPMNTSASQVASQMVAKRFSKLYNTKLPPKHVDFLQAFVIELQRDGQANSRAYS